MGNHTPPSKDKLSSSTHVGAQVDRRGRLSSHNTDNRQPPPGPSLGRMGPRASQAAPATAQPMSAYASSGLRRFQTCLRLNAMKTIVRRQMDSMQYRKILRGGGTGRAAVQAGGGTREGRRGREAGVCVCQCQCMTRWGVRGVCVHAERCAAKPLQAATPAAPPPPPTYSGPAQPRPHPPLVPSAHCAHSRYS